MATTLPRFSITIPVELLNEIDKYQIDNNLESRSAAIQELIDCGIESLVEKGVITPVNKRPIFSDEALQVAKQYDSLSRRDKRIVSGIIDLIIKEGRGNISQVTKVAAKSISGGEVPRDPNVKELPLVDSSDK